MKEAQETLSRACSGHLVGSLCVASQGAEFRISEACYPFGSLGVCF